MLSLISFRQARDRDQLPLDPLFFFFFFFFFLSQVYSVLAQGHVTPRPRYKNRVTTSNISERALLPSSSSPRLRLGTASGRWSASRAPGGDRSSVRCWEGSRRFQAHRHALLLARGSSPRCAAGSGVTWQAMSALHAVNGQAVGRR